MLYRFDQIPAPVWRAFMARYPGATLEDWEPKHSGIMELYFEYERQIALAQFDADGCWLGAQVLLPDAAYPAFVTHYVQRQQPPLLLWELTRHDLPQARSFFLLEVDEANDLPIRKIKFDPQGRIRCEWQGMVNYSRNHLN